MRNPGSVPGRYQNGQGPAKEPMMGGEGVGPTKAEYRNSELPRLALGGLLLERLPLGRAKASNDPQVSSDIAARRVRKVVHGISNQVAQSCRKRVVLRPRLKLTATPRPPAVSQRTARGMSPCQSMLRMGRLRFLGVKRSLMRGQMQRHTIMVHLLRSGRFVLQVSPCPVAILGAMIAMTDMVDWRATGLPDFGLQAPPVSA